MPLVYVDAVPVGSGRCPTIEIALLLRVAADGTISRMVVSGRCCTSEYRDALLRHLEKDLGPLAPPHTTDPTPFTIVEYFLTPTARASTTHATTPSAWPTSCPSTATASRHGALDLAWFNPAEAVSDAVRGDDWRPRPPHPFRLAHVGQLP